jgi:hypothetical protein
VLEICRVHIALQAQPQMGRKSRQCGYSNGSAPRRPIIPDDRQPFSSAPPTQPQSGASSQWQFRVVLGPSTPSTTDAMSPASSHAALSPGAASVAPVYSSAYRSERGLPSDAPTPESPIASGPVYHEPTYLNHFPQRSVPGIGFVNGAPLQQDHLMTGMLADQWLPRTKH